MKTKAEQMFLYSELQNKDNMFQQLVESILEEIDENQATQIQNIMMQEWDGEITKRKNNLDQTDFQTFLCDNFVTKQ